MALAWCLRDKKITSVLFGVRNIRQLNENINAIQNTAFEKSEINEINLYATESNLNIWKESSNY